MKGQDGMSCGKILYAMHEGTWVLRLRGDVRATWCAAFDELVKDGVMTAEQAAPFKRLATYYRDSAGSSPRAWGWSISHG